MFIGQFGLKGLVAYSPWLPRGGDKGVFLCELLAESTNATLDLAIQHKNTDEADSAATTAASFTQITSVGVATKEVTGGLKELWRIQFAVDSSGGEFFDQWVLFDLMTPSWRKN